MKLYNIHFKKEIHNHNIIQSFSAVHLLIKSPNNPNKETQEYAVPVNEQLISIFGVNVCPPPRILAKKLWGWYIDKAIETKVRVYAQCINSDDWNNDCSGNSNCN